MEDTKTILRLTAREWFAMDDADLPKQVFAFRSGRESFDELVLEYVANSFMKIKNQGLPIKDASLVLENIIIQIKETYIIVGNAHQSIVILEQKLKHLVMEHGKDIGDGISDIGILNQCFEKRKKMSTIKYLEYLESLKENEENANLCITKYKA